MGSASPHGPVLSVLAAFSRHAEALDWAAERAEAAWGPIALRSPTFDFVETPYYEPTMGPGLKKVFWVFEGLVSPTTLPDRKLVSGEWEQECASSGRYGDVRPLNLDPGYLTIAKLVLASTKDHSHRIYLDRGIFAETTLYYKDRAWQAREWTFPDYRREDYHAFFTECRQYLRRRQREG